MKKLIILTIFSMWGIWCTAQSHLPDTSKIKLSAKEVTEIGAKLDTVQMLLSNTSTLPSNQITAFNRRLQMSFVTLWQQVQKQIQEDAKKVQPKAKP